MSHLLSDSEHGTPIITIIQEHECGVGPSLVESFDCPTCKKRVIGAVPHLSSQEREDRMDLCSPHISTACRYEFEMIAEKLPCRSTMLPCVRHWIRTRTIVRDTSDSALEWNGLRWGSCGAVFISARCGA